MNNTQLFERLGHDMIRKYGVIYARIYENSEETKEWIEAGRNIPDPIQLRRMDNFLSNYRFSSISFVPDSINNTNILPNGQYSELAYIEFYDDLLIRFLVAGFVLEWSEEIFRLLSNDYERDRFVSDAKENLGTLVQYLKYLINIYSEYEEYLKEETISRGKLFNKYTLKSPIREINLFGNIQSYTRPTTFIEYIKKYDLPISKEEPTIDGDKESMIRWVFFKLVYTFFPKFFKTRFSKMVLTDILNEYFVPLYDYFENLDQLEEQYNTEVRVFLY